MVGTWDRPTLLLEMRNQTMNHTPLGYTVSTAIAATNALVVRLALGNFMSRLDIKPPYEIDTTIGRGSICTIEGMTNTRREVRVDILLLRTQMRLRGDFPIEYAIIALYDRNLRRPGLAFAHEFHYYECRWDDHFGIQLSKLVGVPYESKGPCGRT